MYAELVLHQHRTGVLSMKTITRTFDENGEQILSEPIPQDSLRNVWMGDTCTVYEQGDELPPEPGNDSE